MRNKINLIILLVVFLITSCGTSNHLSKGKNDYDMLKYNSAIKHFEKGLKTNDDYDSKVKLAHSYRLTNQFEKAEYYYGQVAEASSEPELGYYYAKMLLANGKPNEARNWAEKYNKIRPSDSKGSELLEAINNYNSLSGKDETIVVSKAGFNSSASDFSPVYYQDKLVFISDRSGKTNPWTGRAYTSIYLTDSKLQSATPLPGNFKGNYNDICVSFTDNEKTMYFTQNNKKRKKGKDDVVRLSIVSAKYNNGTWSLSTPFPYNSSEYSTLHPAISPDGTWMVFSSDKPGGIGKKDLYISKKSGVSWTAPQPLGAPINSSGNEAFPFISNDGTLYYASDGLAGLGGLDVFYTKKEQGRWSLPQNVGAPINSSKDDFGLITKDQMKSGYYSSNRDNPDGTDDIYSFQRLAQGTVLNGIVVDEFTDIPLPEVQVTLVNKKTGVKTKAISSPDGRFTFEVDPNTEYQIDGIKNNILTTLENISTINLKKDEKLFIKLKHNDPRFTLNGSALTKKDKKPVEGVKVILYNMDKGTNETTMTDSEGAFHFQLEQNTQYQISGEKDGYFSSVQEITTKGLVRSTTLYVKLFLLIEEIIIGKEIALEENAKIGDFEFKDILYDYNKSNIRPDAAIELDKLGELLTQNKGLKIELSSHTDSRGKTAYNQLLSQKRAEAAVAYIVSKGIDNQRVTAKGYGENKLRNHCADGVKCTEKQHQKNRRTEIKILEY